MVLCMKLHEAAEQHLNADWFNVLNRKWNYR